MPTVKGKYPKQPCRHGVGQVAEDWRYSNNALDKALSAPIHGMLSQDPLRAE